nr:integrase, catalytic region, zinc finger, CCHC-type, peptidase aspartic, catalytic [Tanacetum cinerariifolium]
MIMPSKDKMYNGRKGIGFENPSYIFKAKDLRLTLYDERVINLGYTLMFLTNSDEALEIEKFKRARENKIKLAYDYGNLNASYVNEKINLSDNYFQEIINPDFDKIDSSFQKTSSLKPYVPNVILEKIIIDLESEVVSLLDKEKENLKTIELLKSKDVEKGVESSEKVVSETKNKSENDCQVIGKVCDSKENPNVIAPGMFKLSGSQSVSPISVTKTSCSSNSVESKLKRKRRKRTSSNQHEKQVNKDVLRANKAFVYFLDLYTLSSVRRPKPSGVMWMKKGSSNTVKVNLSSVNHSNLNKNVKRYSHKNLMACNNFATCSAFDCNNARNALCNARMNASVDVNDLFVFDDVSTRKSHVSKMPFRKKLSASLNVPSRSKLNKCLPRIIRKWFPKLQPLAEPIVQICLWIIDLRCSKYMTGNRDLLTNFVEKFLGTVRFGNNVFTVIAGYEDVVIGSMTIKKVYYVEGLGHNLFSIGQFCDKGLKVAFRNKMPFWKKPRDSMHVRSKSILNKSLPRTVHRWLPKLQLLAELVAKWFPRVERQIGCSKHMTGNRALLTNFVEKFLGTVRFGNNDFAMIAGYVDVVIGSMTINKVYYVEVLGHNLFSVRQFCDKGLEVAFR